MAGVLAATYGHDTNGNLTSLTTYQFGVLGGAGAATTTWQYDPNSGLLSNKIYADGTSDSFQYNSAGQMTSLTEPGVTGSFGYDAYGNVINSSYVDSTTGLVQSTVNTEDDLGRPVATSNTDNGKTFTTTDAYTPLGDLQSETFGSAGNASINYAYYPTSSYGTSGSPDAAWSVAVNTPGGQSASQVYTYNSNTHRLRWITFNGSVKANYAYVSDSNQISSLSVGNVITTYVPDASDGSRLGSMSVSAAGQVVYSASYTYNADGQRASDQITQTIAANDGSTTSQSQTLTYTYDPNQADALTQVKDGNGNVLYTYSYDGVGNFTSNGSLGSVNSVNEYSNLTYNARHDLTNDGNYTYEYDALDRLISVTPNYPSTGSSEAEYGYDGQGRMAWEEVYNWAGSTTYHFVWSGSELVAKLDANNNLLQQYTWGPGENGIDQVILLTNYSGSTGTSYTLTYDASGNVIMMENALTGAVVANYTYTPYGALTYSTGPEAGINPWLGKGYWTDAAVDRAIAWAQPDLADGTTRTVDLPAACWMQDDPTGISGGLNLRSLDGNDPINNVDPTGTSPGNTVGTDQVNREAVQEVTGGRTTSLTDAEVFQIQAVYEAKVAWYRRRDIEVVIPPDPNGGPTMGYVPPTTGQVVKQYAKEVQNAVNANTGAIINLPATVINNEIYNSSTNYQYRVFEDRSTVYQLPILTSQWAMDYNADPNADKHVATLTSGFGATFSLVTYLFGAEGGAVTAADGGTGLPQVITLTPVADPAPPVYEVGNPGQVVEDHILARAAGGSATDPANLRSIPWEMNARKGAFEGQLLEYENELVQGGLSPEEARSITAPEWEAIQRDALPRPMDPSTMDQIPAPGSR